MFNSQWQTALQYITPQHLLSRFMGLLGNCQKTWVKNRFITWFIRRYGVDMSIAQQPNPLEYLDFNSFFTRALKPEARPIMRAHDTLICPVDGTISQLGKVHQGRLLQAKGFDYGINQLLGGAEHLAESFLNGHFITLYLAPKDYHRVHMPIAGKLREMIYIPGKLFSVNTRTAEQVSGLFARNERVVCIFETDAGLMAVILVGAMIVASISTVWAGIIAPSSKRAIQRWSYQDQLLQFDAGAEIGHFQMGSTVIVLSSQDRISWSNNLQSGQSVQLGQPLGRIDSSSKLTSVAAGCEGWNFSEISQC